MSASERYVSVCLPPFALTICPEGSNPCPILNCGRDYFLAPLQDLSVARKSVEITPIFCFGGSVPSGHALRRAELTVYSFMIHPYSFIHAAAYTYPAFQGGQGGCIGRNFCLDALFLCPKTSPCLLEGDAIIIPHKKQGVPAFCGELTSYERSILQPLLWIYHIFGIAC